MTLPVLLHARCTSRVACRAQRTYNNDVSRKTSARRKRLRPRQSWLRLGVQRRAGGSSRVGVVRLPGRVVELALHKAKAETPAAIKKRKEVGLPISELLVHPPQHTHTHHTTTTTTSIVIRTSTPFTCTECICCMHMCIWGWPVLITAIRGAPARRHAAVRAVLTGSTRR